MMIEAAQGVRHDGVLFEGDRLPLAGLSVVEAKAMLKDAWGIPYFADAFVNGRRVPVAHLLRPGDRLEFIQRLSFKAGGDTDDEQALAEALLDSEPALARLVHEVATLPLSAKKRLSVLVLRVLRWIEQEFGPPTADAVAMLDDLAHRLNELGGGWKRLAGKESEGADRGDPARSPNVRVDEGAGDVVIDGVHYALEPAHLAIFTCLVEAGGACVSRADMQAKNRTLKDEDRIDRVIAKLKRDNKKVGVLIESVRGKGYRLVTND
jgi:hypothetical protein